MQKLSIRFIIPAVLVILVIATAIALAPMVMTATGATAYWWTT